MQINLYYLSKYCNTEQKVKSYIEHVDEKWLRKILLLQNMNTRSTIYCRKQKGK